MSRSMGWLSPMVSAAALVLAGSTPMGCGPGDPQLDFAGQAASRDLSGAAAVDAPAVVRAVINANLHPIRKSGNTCTPPDFSDLGASPNTQANSYHVGDDCRFGLALTTNNHGKPRIISTDSPHTAAEAQRWIGQTCDAVRANNNAKLGHYHFEDYDIPLNDDKAVRGVPIGGFDTFPQGSKDMLVWIEENACASTLPANGRLQRIGTSNKLGWNGQRITLIGFGFMGALTAGDWRLDIEPYLDALASHGVNFTRVWAVEQWTALAVDGPELRYDGLTPFSGTLRPNSGGYYLDVPEPRFYERLRRFAQAAADRGIVVQLSLFDRHGITLNSSHGNTEGRWEHSPYNALNNNNGVLTGDPPGQRPHPGFTTNATLQALHERYLRTVAAEVGGIGNVMFEIINEAHDDDWGNVQTWQEGIAGKLALALPDAVARDSFNSDPTYTLLAGKAADAGGSWWGGNARIEADDGPVPGTLLGTIVSDEDGSAAMSGSLPLAAAGHTGVSVRARMARYSGSMQIQLTETGGRAVYARLRDPHSGGVGLASSEPDHPAPRVLLELLVRDGGAPQVVASKGIFYTGDFITVRLAVDLSAGDASVSVDSAPELQARLPSIPAYDRAGFYASRGGAAYLASDGVIDDFEAETFCSQSSCGAAMQ